MKLDQFNYEPFFDLALELVSVSGIDGRFKMVNPSFKRTLGFAPEELIGKSFIDFVHPVDVPVILVELDRLFAGNIVESFIVRFITKDGVYKWFQWKAVPNLKTGLIYHVAADVSAERAFELEKQTLEERVALRTRDLEEKAVELQRTYQYLDEFVYNAAHDLRAPTLALRSLFEMVQISSDELSKGQALQRLDDTIQHLKDTLDSLIRMIDLQDDHEFETVEVDFKQVFDDVANIYQDKLEAIGARVSTNFERCPTIPFVRVYLISIFQNLLSNAIKYSSGERELALTFSSRKLDNGLVEISAADNGIGIDLRLYGSQIFEPFERFTNLADGKGIGLNLIKKLAERNGGAVDVTSQPGKGSTFFVYLKPTT